MTRPSRQVFFKYMKATVAKTVLATRCLRWSSPLLFNDPFDVTQELRLNFDEHGLNAAVTDRVTWLIEHAEPATCNVKHPFFGSLIRSAMRQATDARQKMARELREGLNGSTPGQAAVLQELKDLWSALVPTFRILCLSELNDVAPMWHHYADKYQGVVLEFFALEEVDSAFQGARPVVYQDAPSIAKASAWVSSMLREGDTRWQDLFMEYLYVKTPAWSYEKEWRIPTGRRPDDSDLFGDYGFHPRELTAIYFGPKCSGEDRSDLLKLLAHGLEHVKTYEMLSDTRQARFVPRVVPR